MPKPFEKGLPGVPAARTRGLFRDEQSRNFEGRPDKPGAPSNNKTTASTP